jgi:hypothetical protein
MIIVKVFLDYGKLLRETAFKPLSPAQVLSLIDFSYV